MRDAAAAHLQFQTLRPIARRKPPVEIMPLKSEKDSLAGMDA